MAGSNQRSQHVWWSSSDVSVLLGMVQTYVKTAGSGRCHVNLEGLTVQGGLQA